MERASGWLLESWTCHVCRRERPDSRISVHSTKRVVNGIEIQENVRYCNDRPACAEGAKEITWLKESDERQER